MSRYFYADPVAAAWMIKHFGMRITCGLPHHPMDYESADDLLLRFVEVDTGDYGLRQATRFDWYSDKFYVHPDSLRLLEPKPGDMVRGLMPLPGGDIDTVFGWQAFHAASSFKQPRIIQRDGKPFMQPESEAA